MPIHIPRGSLQVLRGFLRQLPGTLPHFSCDKKYVSLHQVASDGVKRLEENKVLTQGSEALETSEETQGAQEFLAGTASHIVGDGCLFPGLTMLWMPK